MIFDCILIPGGGLLTDGTLPAWTRSRLDLACSLASQTRMIACLSGGTVHKPPPLTKEGFPVFESKAAASYLLNQGIKSSKIFCEISSYDTIGNAYFSRMLFCDPLALKAILVITSEFHLPRTEDIFKWVYNLPPRSAPFQLTFRSAPNQGISPAALQARMAREAASQKKLQETKKAIRTMKALHRWIYHEHAAYAAALHPRRVSGNLLDSY